MKLKELVGMLIVIGALPPGATSGAEDGTKVGNQVCGVGYYRQ